MFDELTTLCLAGRRPALPQDWWQAFSLAPATLAPLLALLAWLLLRRRRPWPLAGWGLLVLALVSPLCRLAATLAWAHMAQLMLLLAGMALLAMASPRRAHMPRPGPAALAHGVLLWLWHVPGIYTAALQHATLHVLLLALLLGSAWWFWRAVLLAPPPLRGAALAALLATMAHTGLLGALLTFASQPLYPLQAAGARAWGVEPLQDQQLAGLLMWVLGALGYLLAATALALRWFAPATPARRTPATLPR
ncbi:cytochrome c oxidase assembly protein [Pseudorhodoferax sp.]|uniref:cytochrome c oxidase assembly protein n=1 Tax=Pseudorhodoferax sp. TaxID=1993553 RepID=UPI002DD61DCA|nr:cytochrome c oxidase assembly protein [Pseudorhodoferax sp.]